MGTHPGSGAQRSSDYALGLAAENRAFHGGKSLSQERRQHTKANADLVLFTCGLTYFSWGSLWPGRPPISGCITDEATLSFLT